MPVGVRHPLRKGARLGVRLVVGVRGSASVSGVSGFIYRHGFGLFWWGLI